ncbi:hypothetical protein GOP47_0018664 [Adiantum capillus-veneris]|uniref:DHHA2 domain-containing protein n=1 Tax=Adiantum capillus-veneris TaxID=13818 RepID=A0A9D4Z9U4_ADICA|nr:hypothetical protein GOP47_0018664 [Adiantum capillus-veneris]
MSASKRANLYKESPYYAGDYGGGGYVEARKSNNKLQDQKTSDENKLPKIGSHFSVMRLTKNPSTKLEESSNPSWKAYFEAKTANEHRSGMSDPSKVRKIVSGLERGLWGSKESKSNSIVSSIILEEDSFNGEHEDEMSNVFDKPLSTLLHGHDKQNATGDQKPVNGCPPSTQYKNGSQSAIDAPHPTLIPLRPFDLNSTSRNPLPSMGDPPLPTIPPHPKLVHMTKDEEYGGSARLSNNMIKHIQRSSSLESQFVQHLDDRLSALSRTGNNDMIYAQEKNGVEKASLPLLGAPELSFNDRVFSKDTSKKSEEEEPQHQTGFKREDSMDTLQDSQLNFKSRDENTLIKIVGSHKDEKVFLSGVASAFYNGGSLNLHGVSCCPSIGKMNDFLDERRDDLHAGVPGKWLTVVLGKDSSDLSTIVATITYAYFLSVTTREDKLCIVPLVNMVRADLALHPDATWLLDSIGLHVSSLLFLDEINLSYFHRFGSLRLVLVNHTKLCPGQEGFKDDVEEILVVREKVDNTYPHLKTVVSDKDVGSSCTLLAEEFTKHHPEMLAGRALCRLLLAGILLDTTNLLSESTTRRDTSMATLLLNGAGKFGRNGLFKILKQKSHDLTNMSTNELLRKQFKMLNFDHSGAEKHSQQVRRYEENVGMSSLPIPVNAVLAWEEDSVLAIADFPRCMALGLFVLVTGYYETAELFKREILVVVKDDKLLESISTFLLANKSVKCILMPLKGVPSCMRGFSLEGKRISRTCIQTVLEDYFSSCYL